MVCILLLILLYEDCCNIESHVRLAPKGTYKVQEMLQQGAWGCERGGYFGIFTPMYLMVARKP